MLVFEGSRHITFCRKYAESEKCANSCFFSVKFVFMH